MILTSNFLYGVIYSMRDKKMSFDGTVKRRCRKIIPSEIFQKLVFIVNFTTQLIFSSLFYAFDGELISKILITSTRVMFHLITKILFCIICFKNWKIL